MIVCLQKFNHETKKETPHLECTADCEDEACYFLEENPLTIERNEKFVHSIGKKIIKDYFLKVSSVANLYGKQICDLSELMEIIYKDSSSSRN